MLSVAIIYSSQNHSTQKIAEKIKEAFLTEGHRVTLYNTKQEFIVKVNNYDIIGIGCPTYISRPSYEIMDFISNLKDCSDKKIFTFVTYSTEIGDGANWLRRKIKRKGGIDIGHFSCRGKNLLPGYTKNGYLFAPASPTNDECNAVDSFVKNILLNIKNSNQDYLPVYDPKPHFIFWFERFLTNRFFIRHFYSRFFSVDENLCTGCNTCIKNCPAENIRIDIKKRKKWDRNCIFCLKCEISCPQQAISSPISWFIFKPFFLWNINRAVRKNIPFLTTDK